MSIEMTNEEVEAAIKQDLNTFVKMWDSSVNDRLEACRAYAHAVKMSRSAYRAFYAIPRFRHWTKRQWKFALDIGNKRIDPLYLDYKTISIPLLFAKRGVTLTMQRSIFRTGLDVATLNGEVLTVPLIQLQVQQVLQVFDENGRKRSVEEQKEWIKQHAQPNFEVIDEELVVHHKCVLTRNELLEIICHKDIDIKPSDIIEFKRSHKK